MKLNEYLERTGLTQTAFAKEIGPGASQSHVWNWCTGKITPRKKWMARIKTATRGLVTANDFFEAPETRGPQVPNGYENDVNP